MATVIPFKGFRYNPNKVKDISRVVCPPYDVISPQAQERYYRNHDHNIIRVELGREEPDTPSNNRYTRAAASLKDWIKEEVLKQDDEPSLYLYKLAYTLPGNNPKTLKGFLSLVQLEEIGKGKIFPHEFTFPKAKQDRLRLIRACHAQTSPIFMIYSDPADEVMTHLERAVNENHPAAQYSGEEEIEHRLWKVSSPVVLDSVRQTLIDRPFFIADGHHRYETALNFQSEMRAKDPSGGLKPYDSAFVFCATMEGAGLSLLPIHRMIMNPLPADLKTIKLKLARFFEVTHLEFNNSNESAVRKRLLQEMAVQGKTAAVFGLYSKSEHAFHLLKLKPDALPRASKALDSLDVMIFQKLILEEALGIADPAAKKESQIRFVKDEESGVKEVQNGGAGMVFFLNPTRISQVRDVVLAGDRMPQKSTYFYPKPVTGLVLNKF